MLLELAIGDSYGSAFEFANGNLKHNTAQYYSKHPRHPHLPGCYTDDTQMSLALAELLLDGTEFTPLNLANKFLEVYQRDPRTGYSHRFYDFLNTVKSGEEFLKKMLPDSEKSGAAMRAPVLGLLPSIRDILKLSESQAIITHDTPNGVLASHASALLTHYFCYALGPKDQVGKWLVSQIGGAWDTAFSKSKIGTRGIDCVHAALTAITASSSLSEVLITSINFTGDVDTVAAIAMGAASMSEEILNDLSPTLYFGLEDTVYGRDYIYNLDCRLFRDLLKRPVPSTPFTDGV